MKKGKPLKLKKGQDSVTVTSEIIEMPSGITDVKYYDYQKGKWIPIVWPPYEFKSFHYYDFVTF